MLDQNFTEAKLVCYNLSADRQVDITKGEVMGGSVIEQFVGQRTSRLII